MKNTNVLIDHLNILFKKYLLNIYSKENTTYLDINKNNLIEILKFLKTDNKCLFSQLIDLTAVDYINSKQRFEVVYILLSHKKNFRLIIKVLVGEKEKIPSICSIFNSANWYERECYDLFGIKFINHPDLRRIMTDYNFEGHPLRKDFPLTGHTEVHYNDLEKKVVYEPVKLSQEFRNFDYSSPWKGLENQLIGDEKAEKED